MTTSGRTSLFITVAALALAGCRGEDYSRYDRPDTIPGAAAPAPADTVPFEPRVVLELERGHPDFRTSFQLSLRLLGVIALPATFDTRGANAPPRLYVGLWSEGGDRWVTARLVNSQTRREVRRSRASIDLEEPRWQDTLTAMLRRVVGEVPRQRR